MKRVSSDRSVFFCLLWFFKGCVGGELVRGGVSRKLTIWQLPRLPGALLCVRESLRRLKEVGWWASLQRQQGWTVNGLSFPSVSKFVSIVSFFSVLLKWDLGPARDNNILTENSVHGRQGHLHCLNSMCNRDYFCSKQKNYAPETSSASKQDKRDPL